MGDIVSLVRSNQRSQVNKELSSLTNAVVDTVMDAVLYVTINAVTTIGARSISQLNYRDYEADVLLCRYNSKTIRRAISNLLSKKYLHKNTTQTGISLDITQEGIKRIRAHIPSFREKRPWDGYLYLISYDIPVQSNIKRNVLREYLQKIGCGKLQDSLWMTPYNPTGIIDSFVDEQNIPGTILVSKLGKDGSIGKEKRNALIERLYGYTKLNQRYDEFIKMYSNQKHVSPTQLSIEYHAVLKDDPQLPFSLEPEWFLAKKAYDVFRSFSS